MFGILGLLANSETLQMGEVISFVTGAGGAAGVMWLWNTSLKKDKQELRDEKSLLQERNDNIADKAIEALTMVNLHLSNHETTLNAVKEDVSQTRQHTEKVKESVEQAMRVINENRQTD